MGCGVADVPNRDGGDFLVVARRLAHGDDVRERGGAVARVPFSLDLLDHAGAELGLVGREVGEEEVPPCRGGEEGVDY